jgi:hypothetical protein
MGRQTSCSAQDIQSPVFEERNFVHWSNTRDSAHLAWVPADETKSFPVLYLQGLHHQKEQRLVVAQGRLRW